MLCTEFPFSWAFYSPLSTPFHIPHHIYISKASTGEMNDARSISYRSHLSARSASPGLAAKSRLFMHLYTIHIHSHDGANSSHVFEGRRLLLFWGMDDVQHHCMCTKTLSAKDPKAHSFSLHAYMYFVHTQIADTYGLRVSARETIHELDSYYIHI